MNSLIQTIILIAVISLSTPPVIADENCDLENGKKQFNKCAACHAIETDTHLMGPSLRGLIGRKAGSVPDFVFSSAMEKSDIVWSEEILEEYLKAPMEYVPGTVMPFGGIKNDEQRGALVCYIKHFN